MKKIINSLDLRKGSTLAISNDVQKKAKTKTKKPFERGKSHLVLVDHIGKSQTTGGDSMFGQTRPFWNFYACWAHLFVMDRHGLPHQLIAKLKG